MKYAVIDRHRDEFKTRVMCRLLEVKPSGYYAWRKRSPTLPQIADEVLMAHVRIAHAESHATYGAPRVHRELQAQGGQTSKKRVARLMRTAGLAALDRVWVSDITYVPTGEGWLYLAVVLDLGSRACIGWALRDTLAEALTLDALQVALTNRRPTPGLLHHSDRGVHYASTAYRALLAKHGARQSMSRRGDCWDNAVAESFFATLEWGLIMQHR